MNRIVPSEMCQLPGQWEPQKTQYREAEAEAIKQYAKAIKDWALLDDAIEQQIVNQRQFVEWWDVNVGVRQSAGGGKHTPRFSTLVITWSYFVRNSVRLASLQQALSTTIVWHFRPIDDEVLCPSSPKGGSRLYPLRNPV
jgi:hypothetical protein